ncbi:MAG: patatin-like phospholipase family protein [Candidatus Marinimicrobia bacterium]|nr:patatin-like phospholipase family protein [Candidatus Neomarinimicrobiota bacterium]
MLALISLIGGQKAHCKPIKTALVLSGGGARGFGHIGVLKALEEADFEPDLIVGTSMGAIIGGLYASGIPIDQIENKVHQIDFNSILSNQNYKGIELASEKLADFPALMRMDIDQNLELNFPQYLFTTQTIQDELMPLTIAAQYRSNGKFDSLAIPLRILATDIKSGQSVVFQEGNLARLLAASSAMPFLFAPVEEDSMNLVDGGLTNNVPCDVAYNMGADFIITSDLTSRKADLHKDATTSRYFEQTINTLAYLSDTRNLHFSDVYIRPKIGNISSTDFSQIDTLIKAAYQETKKHLERIKAKNTDIKGSRQRWFKKAKTMLDSTQIDKIKYIKHGNIKNYIIKRESQLRKNQTWNLKKARASVGNLYSTNLFKAVSLNLNRRGDTTELVYEVNMRPKSRISFGAFYDSELDATAFLSIEYRNLLESSINNQLYIITSERYQKLAWDINVPRIFTTNFTNYISAYLLREYIPFYQQTATAQYWKRGLDFNFGLNIKRGAMTSIGIILEDVNVENNPRIDFINQKQYNAARISGKLFVDNRDVRDWPTKGKLTRVSYEHSLKNNLDPLRSYAKLYFETTDYQHINNGVILSTHFNGGFMNRAMSYFEQFRLGGVNSFPGYRKDELWGKTFLTAGLVVRYPLLNNFYLRSKIIGGNIWPDFEEVDWSELRAGARLGVSIPTPLGPLSFDYGFNLSQKSIVYFSFGHRF